MRAGRPLRILRALAWDRSVHRRFLQQGARELPRPRYAPLEFSPAEKRRELRGLRLRLRGTNPAEALLRGCIDQLDLTCALLAARGTPAFYRHSLELFGDPRDPAADFSAANLALASRWAALRPKRPQRASLSAAECAREIRAIVEPVLHQGCKVRLSSRIAAFAAAGQRTIAVRRGARFTPRQARALAHHEGLWHVLTARNGAAQPVLTALGTGLAFFTRSQEGGGIASEFLTGNLGPARLAELGERALAIDRAARGADYLAVWQELADRFGAERACHLAERVFRGGVLAGGAPFTKDAIYVRGVCSVLQFLRGALERGDEPLARAFFAGKLALEDAPRVRALMDEGLVAAPRFSPAWWLKPRKLRERLFAEGTSRRFPPPS